MAATVSVRTKADPVPAVISLCKGRSASQKIDRKRPQDQSPIEPTQRIVLCYDMTAVPRTSFFHSALRKAPDQVSVKAL